VATSTKSSSKKNLVAEHPKALIIAEKPSVANDIAKALGGFTKHDEYFENEAFLISLAIFLKLLLLKNMRSNEESGHLPIYL
jgi:DNA topoisomerase-3